MRSFLQKGIHLNEGLDIKLNVLFVLCIKERLEFFRLSAVYAHLFLKIDFRNVKKLALNFILLLTTFFIKNETTKQYIHSSFSNQHNVEVYLKYK